MGPVILCQPCSLEVQHVTFTICRFSANAICERDIPFLLPEGRPHVYMME